MKVSKKIATATALSLALCLAGLSSSQAAVQKEIRISGSDRIETAIKIADEFGKTENVVLATANNYADALVASPMATEMNAPILLNRGNSLDKRVLKKIDELGAKNVTIVGGTGSVGTGVENDLKSSGLNVSRIAGRDRYSTSAEIAAKYNDMVKAQDVVIASGENFPDALVAGPYASKIKSPIILSKKRSVTDDAKRVHSEINPSRTIAVGGASSLNPNNIKITDRISGNNRYDTALKVANYMSGKKAYIASGEIFADSLVAAPLASKTQSPILLRARYTVQNNVKDYVNSNTETLITVGGASTVESGITNREPVKIEQPVQKPQENQNPQQNQNVSKNLTKEEKEKKLIEVKKELHNMINEYRKSQGRYPLRWYEEGEKGSDIRAEEVSRLFAHERPNGEMYKTAFNYIVGNSYSGENATFSLKNVSNSSPKEIAKDALVAWQNSPGHNENMLGKSYDRHTLGVYERDGKTYFVDNLFYIKEMFTKPDVFIIPDYAHEMSKSKFDSMIPDIKTAFFNRINADRKANGVSPIKIADVYAEKVQKETEYRVENPEYFRNGVRVEIKDGLEEINQVRKNTKVYDGDGVDAEDIAYNIMRNVAVYAPEAINGNEPVAYNLGIYFKDGNIQYTFELYRQSEIDEDRGYDVIIKSE